MHVGSPIAKKKARLEIIPLIDVMFFLLAAFMMVSLSMQKLQTIRMNLPAAVAAQANKKIRQLSVAFLFAETIRRITDGESVTSLFAEQNNNF